MELAGVALDLGRFYKTKWLKEPARGENNDSETKKAHLESALVRWSWRESRSTLVAFTKRSD